MTFTIFDDVFIPSFDPYGRNGPKLDDLLIVSNDDRSAVSAVAKETQENSSRTNPEVIQQQLLQHHHQQQSAVAKETQENSSRRNPNGTDKTNQKVENNKVNGNKHTSVHGNNQIKSLMQIKLDKFESASIKDDNSDENDENLSLVDDDDDDDSASVKNMIANLMKSDKHDANTYKKTVVIKNASSFKTHFESKLKCLQDHSTSITVANVQLGKSNSNLLVTIKSKSKSSFDKAVSAVSTWKVVWKKVDLTKDEYSQLSSIRKDMVAYAQRLSFLDHKNEVFINFQCHSSTSASKYANNGGRVFFMIANQIKSQRFFDLMDQYCSSRIEYKKEVKPKNTCEYELISRALRNNNFLRKNNLEKIDIEFRPPKADKNFNGKIFLKGKKSEFDKANVAKLHEVFSSANHLFTVNKNSFAYVMNRMHKFKRDLHNDHINLNFEIADNILKYTMYGFDRDQVDAMSSSLLTKFLMRATSKVIDVDSVENLASVEKVVNEFKATLDSAPDDENDNETTDDNNLLVNGDTRTSMFEVDIVIQFNQKLKKIFLTGTDNDELEQIKTNLQDKLSGSKKYMTCLRYPNLVFKCLIRKKAIIDNIRAKYADTNVFINYNQNYVRLNGAKEQVDMITRDLADVCNSISSRIGVSSIAIRRSEYAFLQDHSQELVKLEAETNSLVQVSPVFMRYASASNVPNGFDLELIHGDMSGLNVDVYVNAANGRLQHAGGLARSLVSRAGKAVFADCARYIAEHGEMAEGDAWASDAGNLGCKTSSLIVHAVGPVCRNGGDSNEQARLKSAIFNALRLTDEKFKKSQSAVSIAIPPISAGIFGYPVRCATKLITDTVIEYLTLTNPKSNVKHIKFISNEIPTVVVWENVLRGVCINRGLEMTSSTKLVATSTRWFWKDDEGKWKPYLAKYSDFIRSQVDNNVDRFDLTMVETGKSYQIDLIAMTQTNKETNYAHDMTNVCPLEQTVQWCWEDDQMNRSPYALSVSEQIEETFAAGKHWYHIELKRHDNDQNDRYTILFRERAQLNPKQLLLIQNRGDDVVAVQHNPRTGWDRVVFRDQTYKQIEMFSEDMGTGPSTVDQCSNLIFYAAERENLKNVETRLKRLIQSAYVTEKVPMFDLSDEYLKQLELDYEAVITRENDFMVIEAIRAKSIELKAKLLEIAVQGIRVKYPQEWNPMDANSNFKIFELDKQSVEYENIEKSIAKTLPTKGIARIERVQNKWLWKMYSRSTAMLKEKSDCGENEKWLFHGTRSTEPHKVFKGEFGFDMKFSNQGMWGLGLYFAESASYSYDYASANADGSRSFFYARVALGENIDMPSSTAYRMPPEKPNQNQDRFAIERFDSIKGKTRGSDIYIIYENGRAYPQYLITIV